MIIKNIKALHYLAASKCASKDLLRPALSGVLIEKHHEKGAYIVGTDGHKLLCIYDEDVIFEADDPINQSIILVSGLIKGRARTLKNVTLDIDTEKKTLTRMDNKVLNLYTTHVDDGISKTSKIFIQEKFPLWKRVVKISNNEGSLGKNKLNINIVNDLLSASRLLHVTKKRRWFEFQTANIKPTGSVTPFQIFGENWFGIVMPIRASNDDDVFTTPKWFKED